MELLSFAPLLKQTLWGGDRIVALKHLNTKLPHVGESWEISALPTDETVVDQGQYRGRSLSSLVEEYQDQLVGRGVYQRYGNTFPLLVKFIDATSDLSIQVHPDDATARRHGHPRGKSEMWFVMGSDPGASILLGLREQLTPDEYKQRVAEGTIAEALVRYPVQPGDCFYVPAGRIHAICQGTFVAEIQQACDLTYRIYDYGRIDRRTGQPRQLHTDLAAESIDFTPTTHGRVDYPHGPQQQPITLIHSPHFTTRLRDLTGHHGLGPNSTAPTTLLYDTLDSFVILIGLEGAAQVIDPQSGQSHLLSAGHTLLVPATTTQLQVIGSVKMLETYVMA